MTPAEAAAFWRDVCYAATAVVGVMLLGTAATAVWYVLWSRRHVCETATPFSADTEAAIGDALAVAEHIDDNPAAEYAVAALRRGLDAWGQS